MCRAQAGGGGEGGGEGRPELLTFFLIINPFLLWFLLTVFNFCFCFFFKLFTFYLLCICREFIGKYVLYGINFKTKIYFILNKVTDL